MKHLFYSDIRGPLVPGTGLALGAGGPKGCSASCPGLFPAPGTLPFSGSCHCGTPFRPL